MFLGNNNIFYGKLPILPPTATKITFDSSRLTGDISNVTFYHVQPNFISPLTNLQLQGNLFTGQIPPLPASLSLLYLHDNQLTGIVPALPNSLSRLTLSNQFLFGTIYLKQVNELDISNTLISNITILDTSTLTYCKLSCTPTLNNTNVEKLYPFCEHLNLFKLTNAEKTTSQLPVSTITSENSQLLSTSSIASELNVISQIEVDPTPITRVLRPPITIFSLNTTLMEYYTSLTGNYCLLSGNICFS
eukprot:NODE_382_length_8372_cov_0.676538.p3 type:complete len:247 gc:universal NODE_382_length_8372_cov_0.676538:2639-1899(-)